MNREQRIAIWVATLIGMLVAWKLFGQSFGSFVRDQPFLAANVAAEAGPFTPLSLSNMVYWVDVYTELTNSGGSSPPSNGEEIYSWGDKSTNNFYFTNYTGVGLTYYTTQGPTNGPVVRSDFDGAQLTMSSATHWSQPNTVFLVLSQDDTANRVYLNSTNSSFRHLVQIAAAPAKLEARTSTEIIVPSSWVASANWFVITVQFNGVSSSIRTNGVLGVSGDTGSQACSRPLLGSLSTGPDFVAEYLMYNYALSSNDVYQVEHYLGTKHNITIP